uniref:Transmembrane protein n=1 Tax=Strongyloides stercoralis TaxID=6248 RepID=A0AAF5I436_STRER
MNNAASIIFIIFLGSLIFFSHGCNVKLNITNGTEKKFQLQVTVLSIKYKSEHLRFKRKKASQLLNIKRKNCDQKKWKIQTLKKKMKKMTLLLQLEVWRPNLMAMVI